MKLKYENILFDLDGTLVDSQQGVINSIVFALKKYGIEVDDRTELKKCVGPPLTYSFNTFFRLNKDDSLTAVEYYREYYSEKGIFETELYDGIKELLQKLKASNKNVIMATSKTEIYAKQIAEHFGIDDCFAFIGGASYDTTRIEKKDVIDYALAECGIKELFSCVMVGDRSHDIIGARLCGIDSIGVLYGYGSCNELEDEGCTTTVDTPEELCNILLN